MKKIPSILIAVFVTALIGPEVKAQQPFTPLKEHEVLKKDAGVWNAKGKMWMPGVDQPFEFEGVETNEMVGGLWCVTDFRGNFGGMPFHGHGRSGFDVDQKKIVGTWFDSTNPHVLHFMGTYDDEKSTLTSESKGKTPDGKVKNGKSVIHHKDADTRIMTSYGQDPADATKMVKEMEIVYTRSKKSSDGSDSKGSDSK